MLSGSLVTTAWPSSACGGEDLQMRRVAANVFNKQSPTANRGWPSSLGVGRGANNHHRKKIIFVAKPRKWMDSLARPKHRKRDMRFGTWNVRSLYGAGSSKL
jgi:hypothetical protein